MNEVKTALKRSAFYYLLLAISVILTTNVIPDAFPTRNLSSVYLLTLSVCLVLYYYHRVSPTGALSASIKTLSWMALLLILLRGVKYSAVAEVGVLSRHTWYLYYVPLLLIPLFLFYISLFVSPGKRRRAPVIPTAALVLTVAFITLVLTNDSHQLVFSFRPDFENWDGDYSRGWLFYAATAWQYALYFTAVAILVVRCTVVSAKKQAWIILIPFSVGIALNVLLLTDRMPKLNGTNLIEFPEALIFTVAVSIECCMQLGLIPTNANYGKLFREFSIAAQITDRKGKPVYSSRAATPLSAEQFALGSGARVGEHTIGFRMELPGGYGFWQDDVTELDRLNEELAETKEALSQEAELIRLSGELKQKQAKIEQRSLVYDAIARKTQRQSQAISALAAEARGSDDPSLKDENRRRIILLGAYIKRYANLSILSRQSDVTEAGELALSVSEVLRYLNYCGVPGELIDCSDGTVPAEAALAAFGFFGAMIEENYPVLRGVLVSMAGDLTFKMTFEGVTGPVPEDAMKKLSDEGVAASVKREDDATYICLTLPEGGETG